METSGAYDASYYAMTVVLWIVFLGTIWWIGWLVWRFANRNAANAKNVATKTAAATIEAARRARDAVADEAYKVPGNTERVRKEEGAYAIAAGEIERDAVQKGLWAKAFADADGDTQKQKALYLKYRASQLLHEQ